MQKEVSVIRQYLWGIFYGVLLTAFTLYVLLDTFVIARVYQTVPASDAAVDENQNESPSSDESSAENQAVITQTSYKDSDIAITITEHRENGTTIYVADVQLSSAEYLKTALANGIYGRNVTEKTSEIAGKNHAILAINGDYYGTREKGYVLRNGVLYRNTASNGQEDLVIYQDGSFEIVAETSISAEQLLANGTEQILSFGPALVIDGQVSVTESEEVGKAKTSNPRTAIGIVEQGHYLFVVSDGRTDESVGLSLHDLAEFMQSIGAKIAYNLDGGGSSTMVFNGEIINNPTTNGRNIRERSVSDIVYIGY